MNAEVTELLARSLTAEELAQRLLDHSDISVRQLARYCLDGDSVMKERIEEVLAMKDDAQMERDEANRIAYEAENLLENCFTALPDGELSKDISKWLASR